MMSLRQTDFRIGNFVGDVPEKVSLYIILSALFRQVCDIYMCDIYMCVYVSVSNQSSNKVIITELRV